MQLGDDAGKAFTYAWNSLLYETDDGPAFLDAGFKGRARDSQEAWPGRKAMR
jgi:hypothetical protein